MVALPRWLTRKTGYKHLRYQVALHFEKRDSWQTITQFYRLPGQYQALAGPVLDRILPALDARPLEITVIGCSTGEEVYSIITCLLAHRPGLAFHIYAYDISEEVIRKAEVAHYDSAAVMKSPIPLGMRETFMRASEDEFVMRNDLKRFATFQRADLLAPDVTEQIRAGDVVFAQNLLFNLDRRTAKRAFANIVSLMREHAVLFCEGMDLDMRIHLTKKFGLTPLEFEIEGIHEDGRRSRCNGWPYHYWGLEPFSRKRRNWRRRYGTIFVRG